MVKKIDRTGETNVNRFGSLMIIEKYYNNEDIVVRFVNSDNLVPAVYHTFRKGEIKNPYDRSLYRIGYLGEGDYKATINKEMTPHYKTWRDMVNRCYNEKLHKRQPTYKGCLVSPEWHNFQTFAQWYDDNYYNFGEKMQLDKDILSKGNKVYSPETCMFVPHSINTLFTKHDAKRGEFPIGVCYVKQSKKYKATCNIIGKEKHLGHYNTKEEAFAAYKEAKEKYIKEVAENYKNKIPEKLYTAMVNYIVEITD